MSTNVTLNGVTYAIPAEGDSGWGTVLSNYFIAIASSTLQKTGGTFTLTAEANFGATYGLKSAYLKSQASNPSATGIIRLGNAELVAWRNAANSADLGLTVNSSNILQFNGSSVLMPGLGSIVNADINASAAIAYSKLNLTGAILNADLAGSIAYSKLSLTGAILNADLAGSIAYSKLVLTGAILNADLAGSIDLSKLSALTASRVLVSDVSGVVSASSVTTTTLGYLDATSSVQTQLDAKVLKSTFSAKGSILAATAASTPADLPVGADGQVLTADAASSPGVKWATPSAAPSSSYEITNLGLATSVGSSALTIALKQADGSSDPSTGASAVKVGMRSSTLTSGLYNQRSVTAALSLVISSGSTLGQTNGVASTIYVYLIDNAGTLELAVSSAIFNENQVVTTTAEGGAGAADSATLMYSTTARSNVPFRLIGKIVNTQTTAGTWASAGTVLQVGIFGSIATTAPGVVQMYAGSVAPSGWLFCDGSAISRTVYADLFAVLSTTYGVGDGSTTFNIPNTQGVFVRGTGSQTIATIGYTGTRGTTQGDQMQGHFHQFSDVNSGSDGTGSPRRSAAAGNHLVDTSAPTSDGTNGNPRYGSETRPANISMYYIIKY